MKSPVVVAAMCFIVALLLSSCVSPNLSTMLTFPRPQVDGPYADHLTRDDIQQIEALPWGRPDIKKPLSRIYVERPDQVDVTGGNAMHSFEMVTGFKVRKKNGRWYIIESSVYQTEAIVTS